MSRPTILLVEDNPITRKMFRLVMETEGFAVVEAGNGAAAIERMTAAPADVVLLDMVLPDIDGGELARRLRTLSGGAPLQMIAMSGFQGLLDDVRGRPGLFDAYLYKPVEPTHLIQVLRASLPSTEAQVAGPSAGASATPGAGRDILVVDDDPVQLKLARVQLKRHFTGIRTASDGEGALEQARSAPPDLILSDVMMPGLDGFDLCLALQRDPALSSIPVVLVSAQQADAADADLARRVGARALLSRPTDFEDLVPTLLTLLSGRQPQDDDKALGEPSERLRHAHAERTRRQLDRHLLAQVEVRQREARHEAQLAILSGVADALTRSTDIEATLGDVVAACLEAGGVERCALYRLDGETPRLTHVLGFPETDRAELASLFGRPSLLLQVLKKGRATPIRAPLLSEEEARDLLSRAGVTSAMFIPLIGAGRCVGALLVGVKGREFDSGQLAFGRAVGAYLGQALVLTDAFARERAARVAAEEASRAKDEFLAMLGHELRNPLTPIVTALHLMHRRAGAVCQQERAIIERQVDHLTRLVDDLLDVARITRGKVELKRQRFEIAEAVTQALETARPLLEQRAHQLSVEVPSAGLVIDGDLTRISQVVCNLISNAAKYTPPSGAIWITARGEGPEVVLSVRDSGYGIAPDMLPRVFDLFAQERQALDRSAGGLGLGLSIVQNLVTIHGGTVSAHSEGLGRGSEFTVRLPVAALATQSTATPRGASTEPGEAAPAQGGASLGGRALRILVVDDNTDAAESLGDILTDEGHHVRLEGDGLKALDAVALWTPDVVLLDIGLPGIDGYEVARRLRQRGESLVLVALTGYGRESDRQLAAEAGFTHHLVKPPKIEAIEHILATLPRSA